MSCTHILIHVTHTHTDCVARTHAHTHTHTHTQSLLNQVQLTKVQKVANETQEALDNGNYLDATNLWSEAEDVIESVCDV